MTAAFSVSGMMLIIYFLFFVLGYMLTSNADEALEFSGAAVPVISFFVFAVSVIVLVFRFFLGLL